MQECNSTEAEGVEQPFTWAVLVFKHCCSLKIHHFGLVFFLLCALKSALYLLSPAA